MKKIFAFIYIISVFVLISVPSARASDQDDTWESDRKVVLSLDHKECQKRWNILWSYAKSGNLEARYYLMYLVFSSDLLFPGEGGDQVTRLRDAMILAVHSIGYKDSEGHNFRELVFDIYNNYGNRKFIQCVKERPNSNGCVQMAVKGGLVPTFEQFAEQIESHIREGYKPECPDYKVEPNKLVVRKGEKDHE